MCESPRQILNDRYLEEVKKHVEIHGISGVHTYFTHLMEEWRDVEINIAVTGGSGVGKSSFINAIRGINDNDWNAAPTGVIETTTEPRTYRHPDNSKIIFWDLPGIGTPNYSDLKTYCLKIDLEKYDTFLIMANKRFTENDSLLAQKVRSCSKSFFFVRTHLDQDYYNESRKKAFNEEEMIGCIRKDCLRNLKISSPGDIFLISNHYQAKWDFSRLTQAIIDVFPALKKESLTLSLNRLTSCSRDILNRKIEVFQDAMGDNEIPNSEEVREYAEKNDLVEIKEFYEKKLEEWKNVETTIAVTGNSGVGKSSLINAIKGARLAKTGPTETTIEPAGYPCSIENKKFTLWDLPGIGTPSCPDLDTYCKKVDIEKYDIFLICSAGSFLDNDLKIAKKLKSMKKPFLFVRTKIDQDIENEFYDNDENEESTLKRIGEDIWNNLSELEVSKEKVFLISNRRKDKYHFSGLLNAIEKHLPLTKKDAFIFFLPSDLKDIIKRKVEVLRGRIWKAASASAAVAAIPAPGLSVVFDSALLMKEINFYKSQLGIPDENSKEFQGMNSENKAKILKYCVTTVAQLGHLLAFYAASSTAEEFARLIPFVGSVIAGSISFGSTYCFLHQCLTEFETASYNLFDQTTGKFLNELDNN